MAGNARFHLKPTYAAPIKLKASVEAVDFAYLLVSKQINDRREGMSGRQREERGVRGGESEEGERREREGREEGERGDIIVIWIFR